MILYLLKPSINMILSSQTKRWSETKSGGHSIVCFLLKQPINMILPSRTEWDGVRILKRRWRVSEIQWLRSSDWERVWFGGKNNTDKTPPLWPSLKSQKKDLYRRPFCDPRNRIPSRAYTDGHTVTVAIYIYCYGSAPTVAIPRRHILIF